MADDEAAFRLEVLDLNSPEACEADATADSADGDDHLDPSGEMAPDVALGRLPEAAGSAGRPEAGAEAVEVPTFVTADGHGTGSQSREWTYPTWRSSAITRAMASSG